MGFTSECVTREWRGPANDPGPDRTTTESRLGFVPEAPARVAEEITTAHERGAWLAEHVLPHERILRAWLRNRHIGGLETDDVIQDTYTVLIGLDSVAHIASPRAYVFQTARSIILRHLRRAQVVSFVTVGDVETLGAQADEPSPERQASSRQELEWAANLIAELPSRCREAFSLRRIDGLPQREVARRMGISESTVEKHIGRALRSLMSDMQTAAGHDLPATAAGLSPVF